MPIYEYRCTACQHKLEALQKFSDAPLVTCPQCAKDTLTKLVSAAGFQLKGSGWYQTDFRGGSKAPADTRRPRPPPATPSLPSPRRPRRRTHRPQNRTRNPLPRRPSAPSTP